MDDPKVTVADTDDEYRKAYINILRMIRNEREKPFQNDYIATLCQSIESLVEEGKRHAMAFMSAMGACRPTFLLFSKAGAGLTVPIILATMPETDQARLRFVAPLCLLVNMAPVDAYIFISEMWTAEYDQKDYEKNFRPPSQRDDRREGLMVVVYTKDHTECRVFDMERDDTAAVVALTPTNLPKEANLVPQNPMLKNLYHDADRVTEFLAKMADVFQEPDLNATPPPKETMH